MPASDDRRVAFPLTPLEDAIVHDEREWPLTIELEARLAEHVDLVRLRHSLAVARAEHPMARVRRRPPGPFARVQQWEEPADAATLDPLVLALCPDEAELARQRDEFLSTPVPLDAAPLLRILLARLPDHDVLTLSIHHGAADGVGAVAFLASISRAYATAANPPNPPEAGDPFGEVWRRHGRSSATNPPGSGTPRRRRSATRSVARGARLAPRPSRLAPRPSRLAPRAPITVDRGAGAGPGADHGYHVWHDRLDPARTRAFNTTGEAREVPDATANDLLLAALHRTLASRTGGPHGWDGTGPISVTAAADLRHPDERGRVVAHLSTPRSTRTDGAQRLDPATALRAIVAQTTTGTADRAREPATSLGAYAWLPARVRALLPRLASRLTRDRFLATARLADLGRVSSEVFAGPAGELGLEIRDLWFSPPARMPQGLAIGAVELDGALHLSYRACRALWDRPALAAFAADLRFALDPDAAEPTIDLTAPEHTATSRPGVDVDSDVGANRAGSRAPAPDTTGR